MQKRYETSIILSFKKRTKLSYLTINNIALERIVSCVPSTIVHTKSYDYITPAEQELFIKTTGIEQRRVAGTETCSDLCFQAAKTILDETESADEIDVILFVSQSPDYILPATAILLQERLGLSKQCIAFDINLGCSGYVYGLSVIGALLQSGQLKKGLLLVGDKSTISTAYSDKSTYPLFGDAGTATLLSYNPDAKPMHFSLSSDGSGKNAIIIEHGHSRHPYSPNSNEYIDFEGGISRTKCHLALDGMSVFNFALREVAPQVRELLERIDKTTEQVDYFVLHQANKLMNESVRKKLHIPVEKCPYSIHHFGNTSSASIPLTMCYQLNQVLSTQPTTVLVMCGFGVGFSWATVYYETGPISTKLIQYDPTLQ
jgi:3-oxoacyl-[acyl-carrier-protein] synthase III